MTNALSGERGSYVPCDEIAAEVPALPAGAIRGQAGGYVAVDQASAPLPTVPAGVIRGSHGGFVAKPCVTGCIDQTNGGRDLATSWIYSTTLTPNMDTYLNRTSIQRTIFGPNPLDQYNLGVHDNQTFYSYRHHLLPEPYPGSPICFTDEDGDHNLVCPPFVTWEHRVARVPTDIGGEHPWHVIIFDLTPSTPTFDHDQQWDWQLMAGDWGTGTPVDGAGAVLLEGSGSYNEGRKEMPERLSGTSLDPYLQFYIRFKNTPPGSARIQVAITDDAAHERILRQCYLP